MILGYILVTFPDARLFLSDGEEHGVTNKAALIELGDHDISLDGDGFAPKSQKVTITQNSLINPVVVPFSKIDATV